MQLMLHTGKDTHFHNVSYTKTKIFERKENIFCPKKQALCRVQKVTRAY